MEVDADVSFDRRLDYLLYPSFEWYRLPIQEREQREKFKDPILAKILNLVWTSGAEPTLVLELDASKLDPAANMTLDRNACRPPSRLAVGRA